MAARSPAESFGVKLGSSRTGVRLIDVVSEAFTPPVP